MNLILLGAPGAGKGTQAQKIQDFFHIPKISTGDMLRAARVAQTPLGLLAESYMVAGKLVPDEVVIGLIQERLGQADCKQGYILDGFPRTLPQAQALAEMLKDQGSIDKVVNIEVSEDSLVGRLTGRRQCEKCSQGYHLQFAPPQEEGICDRCKGKLFQRNDDKEDTIRARLKVYQEMTAPLIEFYKKENLLTTISGSGTVDEIFKNIVGVLNTWLQSSPRKK